ncbi:hypothetical protein CEE45_05235 [Candidatus Heimdallarchaeota archaeon B3_Heim]|nr:MAG: hypothetical protein CEE45_05235 [Candidatus Heimdallarchaeota archaeon B3_Heim]
MKNKKDSEHLMIEKNLLVENDESILLLEEKQKNPEFTQRMMTYRLVIDFLKKIRKIKPIKNFIINPKKLESEENNFNLRMLFDEGKGKSTYSYHKKRMIESKLFSYNKITKYFTPDDTVIQVKRVINEQISNKIMSSMPIEDVKEYLSTIISICSVDIKFFILLTLFQNPPFNFSQIERGVEVFTHLVPNKLSQSKTPTSSLIDGHLKDLIGEKFLVKRKKSRYELSKEGKGLARFLNILSGEIEDALVNKHALYSRSIEELELIESVEKKDLIQIWAEKPYEIISYSNLFMVFRDKEYHGIIPSEKTHNIIYARFQGKSPITIVEDITEKIVPFPKDGTWLTVASFLAENNLDEIPIRDDNRIIGFANKEAIIRCQYSNDNL